MVLRSLVLSILALTLTACNMSGSGQKGPFKAGSTVTLSKLDAQANPISADTLNSKTWGTQGRFSISKIKWNGWTEAKVSGQYFNEFTNANSSNTMSLNAITKKDRTFDIVNIHLYSHLAAARIRQQVNNGESTYDAWKSTQLEMKQTFGFNKVGLNIHRGVEQLSLTRGTGRFKNDNANLLLFTGSFLASGGDTSMLQALSNDFADDGQFNGVGKSSFDAIALIGASDGLLTTLSQNLKNHGAYNPPNSNDMPELPVWVDTDGGTTVDTTPPVISVGSLTVSIPEGTSFTDDVSAQDNTDGDITSEITTSGDTLDTNVVGIYNIVYNVSDDAGNPAAEVTRTVTVTDATPPVIHIGSNEIDLTVGDSFNDDVTATDNIDSGDEISGKIITSGDALDTATAGTYELKYNVTDNAGNDAIEVIRTITITLPIDTTAPVITLNGGDVTVEVNTVYTDLGATAIDDIDGVVDVEVDTLDVDTSELDGVFTVRYTAIDLAGNIAIDETRTVTVVDTTPPIISINGSNVTIIEGSAYNDEGVTTSDNSGLAVAVDTDNPVDINTPNIYIITYTATDTKGNSASATRIVTVEQQPIATTEITGIVKTVTGSPIAGANITVYKEGVLYSQTPSLSAASGNYSLNLASGTNYTLVIQQFGYANQVIPVNNLSGASYALDIVMIENAEVDTGIDPTLSFTGSDNSGSSVVLSANDFEGTDTLQLTITPLDTSDAEERNLIPGDLVNPFTLFFIGLTEFTFINETNNEEVNLAPGQTAEIIIPIYRNRQIDGTPYAVGDSIQLYYLNEDTGLWEQDGVATVIAEASSPTGFSATGTVSHFSWWSLSYPSNPAIIGSYASEDLTYDIAVSSDGQTAIIADASAGIKILDISNFSNITLVGGFNSPLNFYKVRLSSDESKLFVYSSDAAGTIKNIQILDISTPSAITSLVTIPLSGLIDFQVSSDDTKLFVAKSDRTFEIIDISIPASPTVLDSANLGGFVKDMAISNDEQTAFFALGSTGLVMIDITNPSSISIIGVINTGFANGVAISSDATRAYVSEFSVSQSTQNKLHIIDTSNPSSPLQLGEVVITDQGRDVVISSTQTSAYVASWLSGLQVIDISNNSSPILVGNVNTDGRSINLAISLDDKHVFIADWEGGLQIVDTAKALLGDSIPPTITLNGDSYINHPLGTPYIEQGATAIDDLDGTVTVNISGTVDPNTLHSFHEITYTATDSSGNTSTIHRTVYIVQGPETGNTIIDAVSGLEIQDNETVSINRLTWFGAIGYCQNLVLNGLDDWRLPNQVDMDDITSRGYIHAFNNTTNDFGFITGSGSTGVLNSYRYWSSVEDSLDPNNAYHISNEDGVFSVLLTKVSVMGARCVRN